MNDPGFISLVPTLVVFFLAVITRRPIESLISGSLVGLGIIHGSQFIGGFAGSSIRVMTDPDVAWVILVCGFMGSMIGLLIRTGATSAFTEKMSGYVKSQKSALMATWVQIQNIQGKTGLCCRFYGGADQRNHSVLDLGCLFCRPDRRQ